MKTASAYRKLKRFDVITVSDRKRLIVPPEKKNEEIIFFVSQDEIFDILLATHVNCGHGGRNRMEYELKKKYKNIS